MISLITFSPLLADGPGQFFGGMLGVIVSLAILTCVIRLIHSLFSMPMKRAERARLFLDLLEGALERGQSIEEMILSLAQFRDESLGVRFHVLAAHIENGLRFGEALKKVPGFLPPQISAILLAGENLGDLKKVLPACGEILQERPAGVRSAKHYLLLVIWLLAPAFWLTVTMTTVFIIPRFKDIFAAMGVPLWAMTIFFFRYGNEILGLATIVYAGLIALTLIYIGGPRLGGWLKKFMPADWIAWRLSWKRKRLLRTFSAMLAVLLDGSVPEAVAVRLAGDCTANKICRRRAERIVTALQQGEKLEMAVRAFDERGEFRWRLANAAQARGGFLKALNGWHQALDAKAFQQEEAAAHAITTGVVILNGLLVALIALATFGMIIVMLKEMVAST